MSWYKSMNEYVDDKMAQGLELGLSYYEARRRCIEDVRIVWKSIPPYPEWEFVWRSTVKLDRMKDDYMEKRNGRLLEEWGF